MNKQNPSWVQQALSGRIDEAIFDRESFGLSRRIAEESWGPYMPEQVGYFGGLFVENKFFVFTHTPLGNGWDNSCEIYEEKHMYRIFEERLRKALPNYRTLIYHTHPRVTEESLRRLNQGQVEEILRLAKEDISLGIFDYLKEEGREVSLDTVLTELLSRNLNQKDIDLTPGGYHLLITNTISPKNSVSHFNLYDIKDMRRVFVKESKTHEEENILKEARKIDRQVIKKWNKDVWGHWNVEKITRDPTLLESFHNINYGYIEPLISS